MNVLKKIEKVMNGKSSDKVTPRERLSPAESSLAGEITKCIRELFRGTRICGSRFSVF